MRYIDIVFDRIPGHASATFIEVENEAGASVSVGDWTTRPDGTAALRINMGIEPVQIAPLGGDLDRAAVHEVWDTFVKPDQDSGMPQSVEMHILMACLRTLYKILPATPEHPDGA